MDEPGTGGHERPSSIAPSERRASSLSRSLRSRFGDPKSVPGKGMATTRARKLKHVKIIPSSVKVQRGPRPGVGLSKIYKWERRQARMQHC